ncbi:MAG: Pyridoxal-5-phosphate-dependent enzyme beta subunit [Bryobacterales bacterium]|nr:Pyridoxal-5-phosphate-dependent enzyme beta subunit [Bryobacterales bacterium]
MNSPTAAMVVEASLLIRPLARRTPVMTSRSVNERSGKTVFFKCENLQRGGSFKVRGASNLILSLSPDQVARGVVAFSSGNHAQGVAIAAKHVGAQATIVMPEDAPRSKVEPTRALGARIVTYDRMREDREEIAARLLEGTGATLVPPYDHPMIIAGQGTAALELLEDAPHLDALVTCLGGGGLTSGCALIAKEMNPAIRIFGVEPELGNDYFLSRQAGKPIKIPPPTTIADGLRTMSPGKLTFPIVQELVESVLLVTDQELRETMRFLLMRMKILVEPSGAAAAAAVLFGKLPADIGTVGAIISGGNVDLEFQV